MTEYKVGDRILLRKPKTHEECRKIPWGTDKAKIAFMDERTVYIIEKMSSNFSDGGTHRIYLKGVETYLDRYELPVKWSWNESWLIPAQPDVTDKVHNILKGLNI